MLKNFSIITLTFKNDLDLNKTIRSIETLIKNNVKHIIVDGARRLRPENFKHNPIIINDNGLGIYDAINCGIERCTTKYFMLLHSGDVLTIDSDKIILILSKMSTNHLDLILGNQKIDFLGIKRNHSSKYWNPWMFNFGAQPPHLPIIYNLLFVKKIKYSTEYKIISDFIYLKVLFTLNPKFQKIDLYMVEMIGGGKTTNGLKSYFDVSLELIRYFGIIKGLIISVLRIPFKFLQMFR